MTIPEQERGKEFLSTLMAELLPHTLRTEKLQIAVRGVASPLAFRSAYLCGSSIFEYWVSSAKSKEKEDHCLDPMRFARPYLLIPIFIVHN